MGKSEILRKSTSPLNSPTTPVKIKVERETTPTSSSAAAPIGNISSGPGGNTNTGQGTDVPPLPPAVGTAKGVGSGSSPDMQQVQPGVESKPITLSKLMHARAQRSEYYQGTGVFSFELHRQSSKL